MSVPRDTGKYKSHLTILIEKATDVRTQSSENWSLFMRICDYINTIQDAPKEGAKIIRKRLGCKIHEIISLTLTLLETCMKNCNRQFQMYVATPKFMQDLVKVLNPKHHPPIEIQNQVLGLIQAWAHAFRAVPELKEFGKVYQELKDKNVEFPPLDKGQLLVAEMPPARKSSAGNAVMHCETRTAAPRSHSPLPADLSKLTSELAVVRQNCRVFNELLLVAKPGQESQSDLELLEDLKVTCQQMQKRITEIIEGGHFDQVTAELLAVNDELISVFERYEQHKRRRSQQPTCSENFNTAPENPYLMPIEQTRSDYDNFAPADSGSSQWGTLIDLYSDASSSTTQVSTAPPPYPTEQFSDLSLYTNCATSAPVTFDPFIVHQPLRPSTVQTTAMQPDINPAAEPLYTKPSEIEEMESWLKANPKGSEPDESGISKEFSQFLSRRAQESDRPQDNTYDNPFL